MKYKVGDKVKVKSYERLTAEYPVDPVDSDGDLIVDDRYFVAPMKEYCGKTLEISAVYGSYYKTFDGGGWSYTDGMLEDCPDGNDVVNHPPHYTQGGIECIDAMEAAFGAQELAVYCKIAAFKYIWRCVHKNGLEDIKKAVWYLNKYMELMGKEVAE
jgi:hypothetical protein